MFIMRSLSPIFDERTYYKPFEYPWAFDYYTIQNQLHWLPEDVPMHEDVKDWNQKLSPSEKNLLTQIFRLFTQSDVDVGAGYYEKYIPMFRKPELRMMMGSFANIESIHQHAYSLLLDTVGMPESEYKAFAKYEEMSAKHDYIHQFKTGEIKTKKDLNGDGHISKAEMELDMEFKRKRLEDEDAMRDAQRKMTWFALAGLLLYPIAIVIATVSGLTQASQILGDMAPTYFVAVAGIVAAFFGSQALKKK